MISDIQPNYRNCLICRKKVPYYGSDSVDAYINKMADTPLSCCQNCGTPFSQEQTRMIKMVIALCKHRVGQQQDPTRIQYSTFYPAFSPARNVYNYIYAIPLFSIEELLIVENLLHHGKYQTHTDHRIASFRDIDQPSLVRHAWSLPTYDGPMKLLSWHPLLWNEENELFFVGPDEGPQAITWTPYETGGPSRQDRNTSNSFHSV